MTKDEGYWLNVAYVVCALIGAYLGFKLFETVGIQTGWGEKHIEWYPSLSTFGGLVIGAVGTWVYAKKPGRREHHINVIKELAKVAWPSTDDTKRMTWVVVVVVAIFSGILSLFDLGWAWVLRQILA
jgi:preprotein translocase SecE subunit